MEIRRKGPRNLNTLSKICLKERAESLSENEKRGDMRKEH